MKSSHQKQDREKLLDDARRRLRKLELEWHRVKAILARFEAAHEDEIADELERTLQEEERNAARIPFEQDPQHEEPSIVGTDGNEEPIQAEAGLDQAGVLDGALEKPDKHDLEQPPGLEIHAQGFGQVVQKQDVNEPHRLAKRIAVAASVLMHFLLIAVCATWGFRVMLPEEPPLTAEWYDPAIVPLEEPKEPPPEALPPVEIDSIAEDLAAEIGLAPATEISLTSASETITDETQVELVPVSPVTWGDMLGEELVVGQGSRSQGERGKRVSFFGTPALAERVVFLVDNSNSMDEGRFRTALIELNRSVRALTDRQQFFVVFYSDAIYPLFHPLSVDSLVVASPENKRRFSEWLDTVEMCTGGRIVDAIERAIPLNPEVVFLLSDGVMGEVSMEYLIGDEDWPFTIHTIGMTVPNLQAAQNLQTIAAAHGGVFRPVQVHPIARALDERMPIKKNRRRGTIWGIRLPK